MLKAIICLTLFILSLPPPSLSLSLSLYSEIGPYANAAGLTKDHFAVPIREGVFPHQETIKKGLVIELHEYLTKTLKYPKSSVAYCLIRLAGGDDDIKLSSVEVPVSRLVPEALKINRNDKDAKKVEKYHSLMEEEFSIKRKRKQKADETPTKKRLREELQKERVAHRKSKRKLASAEESMSGMQECINESQGLKEQLSKERQEKDMVNNEVKVLREETKSLQAQFETLCTKYKETMETLNQMSSAFDPIQDDLALYKSKYENQSKELEALRASA